MAKKERIRIEVIKGIEGQCLSIDEYRFVGPKPWAGGSVIQTWMVDKNDFIKSLERIGINRVA